MKRKITVVLATLFASKNSLAGSAGAGALGAALAASLGFDPLPWIIGAIGGIIVRVKMPTTSRVDSIINGVISVMLGGLAAPWGSKLIAFKGLPEPGVYLVAFVLAAAWPWIATFIGRLAQRKIKKAE